MLIGEKREVIFSTNTNSNYTERENLELGRKEVIAIKQEINHYTRQKYLSREEELYLDSLYNELHQHDYNFNEDWNGGL